jgi:hypothetical protein
MSMPRLRHLAMLRIRGIQQVSDGAPAEWRGVDQHGAPVRLRYDSGAVTVLHGESPDRSDVVCYRRLAPPEDSSISYAQLRAALDGIVDLPPSA